MRARSGLEPSMFSMCLYGTDRYTIPVNILLWSLLQWESRWHVHVQTNAVKWGWHWLQLWLLKILWFDLGFYLFRAQPSASLVSEQWLAGEWSGGVLWFSSSLCVGLRLLVNVFVWTAPRAPCNVQLYLSSRRLKICIDRMDKQKNT